MLGEGVGEQEGVIPQCTPWWPLMCKLLLHGHFRVSGQCDSFELCYLQAFARYCFQLNVKCFWTITCYAGSEYEAAEVIVLTLFVEKYVLCFPGIFGGIKVDQTPGANRQGRAVFDEA